MVRLRFQRVGRPHSPHYRLVAIESSRARDAACLEVIGHYHPKQKSDQVDVNLDRLNFWLGNGAMPSPSARSILKKSGLWRQPAESAS